MKGMDSSKYSSLKKLYIYLLGMGSTTEGGGWPCPWGTGSLMLWPGPGPGPGPGPKEMLLPCPHGLPTCLNKYRLFRTELWMDINMSFI